MKKMQRPSNDETAPALSDAVLKRIFALVPSDHRRQLPAVCRNWARLCQNGELWGHVHVALDAEFLQHVDVGAMYGWFLRRGAAVRQLEVEISSADSWAVIHGLLGVVGRHLQHLRIYGDSEACYEPGGRAAWLALVPELTSLEVENAADWTIGLSHFPAGLTHLELGYCGEEGLQAVPSHLTEIRSLISLSLQGSQLDSREELCRLQACTQLQRLNLSDCCLEEVPECLAALRSLTSLTLNMNGALGGGCCIRGEGEGGEEGGSMEEGSGGGEGTGGGSGDGSHSSGSAWRLAALAGLTRLQALEMRECELTSVPASVTSMTTLRTLLLGLNCMDPSLERFVLPGPYLSSLAMLGLSENFPEESGVTLERLAWELEGATALEVLRINRNPDLKLTVPGLEALLRGKPRFRRLEYSEEMAQPGLDVPAAELAARFPGVSFRAVD